MDGANLLFQQPQSVTPLQQQGKNLVDQTRKTRNKTRNKTKLETKRLLTDPIPDETFFYSSL